MYNKKNVKIILKKNGVDNPTDSLTTYSLMAVLAGGFFVQVLLSSDQSVFLSCINKIIILATSGISTLLILLSVEIAIDVFHFTYNNKTETVIKSKYKKQLLCYNIGVVFLVFTFVYSFLVFLVYHFCTCFNLINCPSSCINYYILFVLLVIIFPFVAKKWIEDINFLIFKAEFEVENPQKD